jgi:hypothetical protein
MGNRRLLTAILAVFTLAVGTASAQKEKKNRDDTNTRIVQGFVTDTNNDPVAGAVVQLKDTKTLQVRSFFTQQNGDYHFAGLSKNVDYELKAEKSGASSGSKTLSVFDSRKTAVINLKLDKK